MESPATFTHLNLNISCRQIGTCDVLNRLAGGLTFLGLFILESGGYTPIRTGNSTASSVQHDNSLSKTSIAHIRALHCFFPSACVAVAGLCLFSYRLDRSEHSKLVQAIAALDASNAAFDLQQLPVPPSPSVFIDQVEVDLAKHEDNCPQQVTPPGQVSE